MMLFDDRLATVLRARSTGDLALRTQFRQLLDIMGEPAGNLIVSSDPGLIASAWQRIAALESEIPFDARAAMVREPGWALENPDLVLHLARGHGDVAAAALRKADLPSDEWLAVIAELPVRVRGVLRERDDLPHRAQRMLEELGVTERALPAPVMAGEAPDESRPRKDTPANLRGDAPEGPTEASPDAADPFSARSSDAAGSAHALFVFDDERLVEDSWESEPDMSDIVASMFDQVTRPGQPADHGDPVIDAEQPAPPPPPAPSPAPGPAVDNQRSEQPATFGFASDDKGKVVWANPGVAPMVIGTRLIAAPSFGADEERSAIERAYARRQPFARALVELEGAPAISGEWLVDANPRFSEDGRFTGYAGRFARPAGWPRKGRSAAEREGDRIRQLLHELRTPVTAVQGYAEVIQQQLFGSAPHHYRALAAAIAADAARILSGFDDLDLLARLETGAVPREAGEASLATVAAMIERLQQALEPRGAMIELIDDTHADGVVAVAPAAFELILWRLFAALAGACALQERIVVEIESRGRTCRLSCDLPESLTKVEDLFNPTVPNEGSIIQSSLFGAGFSLRLARTQAQVVGGSLRRVDGAIVLTLPRSDDGCDTPRSREEALDTSIRSPIADDAWI
ncbi:MAG: histidine kinase dimerization/phospho-acceptor domain-containing protein [Erythrobacter sp.]|jgi:hypothetical protein|nr:histidine kinase dimerization/phospho-acceptor domain-containing protein [Erythrobacter sp.]